MYRTLTFLRSHASQLLLWICAITISIVAPLKVIMSHGMEGDVFWQLKAGQYALAHGGPLRFDLYSYTMPHVVFFNVEWFWQLCVAWLARYWMSSIWYVAAIPVALTGIVSMIRIQKRTKNTLYAVILGIILVVAITDLQLRMRPVELSFLLLALELLILDVSRKQPKWLWSLIPLFVLWANVHGSYLLGLVAIFTELGVSIIAAHPNLIPWITNSRFSIEAKNTRKLVLASIGCTLATLISPFGISGPISSWQLTFNSQINQYIEEWGSPNFHNSVTLIAVAVPVILIFLGVVFSSQKIDLRDTLLMIALFIGSLHSGRMVLYFLIVWVGLQCSYEVRLRMNRVLPVIVVLTVYSMVAIITMPKVNISVPYEDNGHLIPVQLLKQAERIAIRQHGYMFSTYSNGNWEVYAGIPDFIDGRGQLYTSRVPGSRYSIMQDYVNVEALTVSPSHIFKRFNVQTVVWRPDTALTQWLSENKHWKREGAQYGWILFAHTGSSSVAKTSGVAHQAG